MKTTHEHKAIRRTVPLYARVPIELRNDLDFIAAVEGTTRNELVQLAVAEMVATALGDKEK